MKRRGITLLLLVLVLLFFSRSRYQQSLQTSLSGKVIRFHVLANSDGERDQRIKRKVRDDVGKYVEGLLLEADNLMEAKAVMKVHLQDIAQVATESLKKQGADYTASAELARCDFPVKSYDDFCFPKGEYEALRVKLGAAKGHNWWCVMYPNLCFSASMKKIHKRAVKQFVKSLSPGEYEMILKKKKFKLRWKFLEYFRKKRYNKA